MKTKISILLIFISHMVFCQNTPDDIYLNSVYSGNHNILARKSVALQPGFSYTASSGNVFTASVNPRILNEPSGSVTGNPGGTIGGLVNNNGVVGSIPGQFSVGPSGAATYSVPIEVPAGINGMTPSVSLIYNSQSGNGIAGWGWNIAGLSAITRSPKVIYYDGEAKEIKWDETDVFSLDGMRLFIKSTYPGGSSQANADSIEYNKDSDYTTKIMGYNYTSAGPARFKVWSGDGKVFTYAQKQVLSTETETTYHYIYTPYPDIRNQNSVSANSVNKVYAWYLSSVKDAFNNQIIYNYEDDLVEGNVYPGSSLFYAMDDPGFQYPLYTSDLINGNDYYCITSGSSGSTRNNFRLKEIIYAGGDYKLVFNYDTRTDIIDGYLFGEEVKNSKRLRSIQVNYLGGQNITIKDYSLLYTDDSYSRLSKIQLAGMNSEKFNYSVFNWSNDNCSYTRSANNYTFQNPPNYTVRYNQGWKLLEWDENPKIVYPADFNGDGLTDFFMTLKYVVFGETNYQFDWAVYKNPGSATSISAQAEGSFPDPGKRLFYIFDSDLDGKSELFIQVPLDVSGTQYVGFRCYKYNDDNTAFGRYPALDFNIQLFNASWDEVKLLHSDFDGDGKPDYLLLKSDLSFCNSKDFNDACGSSSFGSSASYFITDINGNGKQEVVFIKNNQIQCWEFDKSSNAFVIIPLSAFPSGSDYIYTGDFNGDRNSDLLVFDRDLSQWRILTSTGKDFTTSSITPPQLKITQMDFQMDIIVEDFNQDGKSDILEFRTYDELRLYISKGNSFELKVTQTGIPFEILDKKNAYCGLADNNFSPDLFIASSPYYYSFSPSTGLNQINSISSGLGDNVNILYGKNNDPYGEPDTFQSSDDNSISIITVPVIDKTVSSINNDLSYSKYKFGKPIIHSNGKGFLGYEYITETDSIIATGTKSISRSHYKLVLKEFLKYALVADTSTKKINNDLISKSINYYSSKSINNQYHVLLDSVSSSDFLNSTRSVKKLLDYNEYLSPTVVVTQSWSGGTKEAESTDNLAYTNNINNGRWIIGQLTQKMIRNKRPGEKDHVRRYDYEYFSTNGALKDEYTEKSGLKEVKKSYTYDNFGNITSETTVAPDDPTASSPRTISATYTSDGRFAATKTDVLSNIESYSYSDITGLLTSKTDINGFLTSYTYDGMGRLKKTIDHNKLEEMTSLFWAGDNSYAPANAVYYSYKQASGESPVTTFYDKNGKELRTVSIGLTGSIIFTEKQYNSSGLLWKESLPYLSSGSPLWTEYTYDDYNRISNKSYPDQRFEHYTYSARQTSVVSGVTGSTHTTTNVVNSLGETIENTDNAGNKVITRYFASGLPKEMQIDGLNYKTRFTYDVYGNRDTIFDPDAGYVTSSYNTLGYLINQKDNKNVTTSYTYDLAGRVNTKTINGVATTYSYDSGIKGVLTGISYNQNNNSINYVYDSSSGLLISQTETITGTGGNKSLTHGYSYDLYGRIKNETLSAGYQITNSYNDYGYLYRISDGNYTLWEATGENVLGQVTNYSQGPYSTTVAYNSYGDLQEVVTSGNIRNMSYRFDSFKNLHSRQDNLTNQQEVFSYDNLNRLTGITYFLNDTHYSNGDKSVTYDITGNITGKTGIADANNIYYGENNYGPHALTSVHNSSSLYSPLNQVISYTDFNRISVITDTLADKTYRKTEFTYGIDNERKKSIYTYNTTTFTKYFFDDYEETNNGSATNKYFYVSSPTGLCAIYVIDGSNTGKLYYIFTDHLGSLTEIIDASTGSVARQSFDAWGKKRSVADWRNSASYDLFADRGFTGHEHLEEFDLINMNGRVYDPALGRFLSPDPYVQMPDFSQSFNRYSYCLNNPLIYTDPSGDFIFSLFLGPLGAVIDAACWSAAIDAGVQGFRIGNGKQDKFNWAELGGAAIGGAVGSAFAVAAPAFTQANLFTRYSTKALYAGLTGAAGSGAGMFGMDLLDNGQIDFSGKDYLKGMALGGGLSMSISLGSSAHDYSTWDKFSDADKINMLNNEFGNKVQLDNSLQFKSGYKFNKSMTWGDSKVSLRSDALATRSMARALVGHELVHLNDFASQTIAINHGIATENLSQFIKSTERNAYTVQLYRPMSGNMWFETRNFAQSLYGLNTIPKSFSVWQLIYNIW